MGMILSKFRSITRVSPSPNLTPVGYSKLQGTSPALPSGDLRRRIVPRPPVNVMRQSATPINTSVVAAGTPSLQHSPFQGVVRPMNSPFMGQRPLPRPILPQQRSYLDRLIDVLVGDGPSNRYALICRHCESHNGMALKEEFEYFGFRCCYCNFWNPARKQKPFTPKIDVSYNSQSMTISEHESSPSEEHLEEDSQEKTATPSDSDSDIEVVERPTGSSEETGCVNEEPVMVPQVEETHVENVEEPDKESEKESKESAEESEKKEIHECEESVEKMDIDESFS
ncbi:endoplasmic reticulum junction formation protein lunapark-B [Ceratina calcarata]|uniref:Endoplasmic reticulum junction formation protein lunapark n=1 Tax=Ceratina calcarata TaxID=156304 RepID=A0AAJ7JEP5_9HYME|nr:endoplasmic reticulum junction formation protein lunapark-B [Ceratina calcarata]